jgi:hypothetical protein
MAGGAAIMVNFHLPLPADLHDQLREEADRSGQPATAVAREALRVALARSRRQRLHDEIAAFASQHAGSDLDLDEDLERAGIEVILASDDQ